LRNRRNAAFTELPSGREQPLTSSFSASTVVSRSFGSIPIADRRALRSLVQLVLGLAVGEVDAGPPEARSQPVCYKPPMPTFCDRLCDSDVEAIEAIDTKHER
jgi:hypothetical protein